MHFRSHFKISSASVERAAVEAYMRLLKQARSALVYLAIGVGFEERRRQPGLAGVQIEELPLMPYLTDAEKL